MDEIADILFNWKQRLRRLIDSYLLDEFDQTWRDTNAVERLKRQLKKQGYQPLQRIIDKPAQRTQ